MDIEITIHSNIDDVISMLESASRAGLQACGMTAETHAKEYETAVITSRLRNSITYASDDETMVVGTNVFYAPYIEFGTAKRTAAGRPPLHYLRKSLSEHVPQYKQLLEDALEAYFGD